MSKSKQNVLVERNVKLRLFERCSTNICLIPTFLQIIHCHNLKLI